MHNCQVYTYKDDRCQFFNQPANSALIQDVYQPLLASGVITGASVFDADISLAADPPFSLESSLWG